MEKILVIEDEINLAAFIKRGFTEEGYEVLVAVEGDTGIEILEKNRINLVLLDIILPGMSGLEICKKIREMGYNDLPILMLTALGTTENVVEGLDSGADDYLVKPFKFKELLARSRALLRRRNLTEIESRKLSIDNLILNRNTKAARRDQKEIKLTATEYRLLEYFLCNQQKVLSRIELLENVWEINFDMGTNVVDVYVNYLRNKIDKGYRHKLIHTVIGMGYIMKIEDKNK